MKTYQDFLEIGEDIKKRSEFISAAISQHVASDECRTAATAELYYRHENPTIMHAMKVVYNMLGKAVPDVYAANNKIPCKYYAYFVNQQVQFLLGNGATFSDEKTKPRLGIDFDTKLQKIARYALNGGVAFGFFNLDHIEVFKLTEFVPMYDEEDGFLKAGIRFWQLSAQKPVRATLYEMDGFTEWIDRHDAKGFVVLKEKRSYILREKKTAAEGVISIDGGNYPTFPIVPFYNTDHQSAIAGGARNKIDAYDLVASQMVNSVDEGNLIYWVLKNCGGMDQLDDAKFIEQLKVTHVAHADGDAGSEVTAHTVEAPINANKDTLDELRSQLFDDFMALDVKNIASGATTATQIEAAYEPLNQKTDLFEYEVIDFVQGILRLIGIEDTPTFNRSKVVNQLEATQMVLMAADYLDDETILSKLPWMTPDDVQRVLDARNDGEAGRFGLNGRNGEETEGTGEEG